MKKAFFCVTAMLLVMAGGCGGPEEPKEKSNAADRASAVKGNNRFAVSLYSQLAKSKKRKGKNFFCSPFSISTALAMTYAGARGNTEKQMRAALHFNLAQKKLHPAFADLTGFLNYRGSRGGCQLSVANALWAAKKLKIKPDFAKLNEANYSAGLRRLEFRKDPEAARQTINKWVEERTENRIKELLKKEPPDIKVDTRLVLTNAIYFKGQWAVQFKKKYTRDGKFKVAPGREVKVRMMTKGKDKHKLLAGEGFQALELPYKGDELSMVIFLPAKVDGLADFEKKLTSKKLAGWLAALEKRGKEKVIVSLPRFEMTSEFKLNDALKKMGMTDAFDEVKADFSGMSDEDLLIDAVLHKAFVKVDEVGTEAAAATAVVMAPKSAPRFDRFTADHPFLFLIRDGKSGSILFLGRVIDPTK